MLFVKTSVHFVLKITTEGTKKCTKSTIENFNFLPFVGVYF